MEAYRELFREQLTERPKKMLEKTQEGYDRTHGWVFLTNDFKNFKAVRTYATLFKMYKDYTYFTPNTFYRNDQRHSAALRWLNAIVVDVDVKNGHNEGLTFPELMDRINDAGLPLPSLIVQTPSGGYHVYFYLQYSTPAFDKIIYIYEMIQYEIAKEIGGDIQAIGAERWFRIPTAENIIFQSENRVSLQEMIDWFEILKETEIEEKRICIGVNAENILQHPAIQKLLQGVEKGKRNNTCYTLALAFKAAGYSKEETEKRLMEWNQKNEPALTKMEIKRTVKSAFKKGAPKGPKGKMIRELSGMPFFYRPIVGAKKREERVYSHFTEWKKDIITFLKKNGGQITGSQREIAKMIGIPYSSFKEVIKLLETEHLIIKEVKGKGRGAKTTLKLTNIIPLTPKKCGLKCNTKNEPNPITFIDRVVGGFPRFSYCGPCGYCEYCLSMGISVFFSDTS